MSSSQTVKYEFASIIILLHFAQLAHLFDHLNLNTTNSCPSLDFNQRGKSLNKASSFTKLTL